MLRKKSMHHFLVAIYGFVFFLTIFVMLNIGATASPATPSFYAQAIMLSAQADTFVSSGRSTERNPTFRFTGVGYETLGDYQILRTLLQFDTLAIPKGSQIVSATLGLYLAAATGPNTDMQVTVQQVLAVWSEDVNWNEQPTPESNPDATARTMISKQAQWYTWDVQKLLQNWANNPMPSAYLGLMLKGDESATQHQRAFWSKDCTESECMDKKPYLRIVYELPRPTPTPTSTATPTPIPTPTPGIQSIRLRNEPQGELLGGDEVTYTIEVQNGTFPLTDLVVSNVIPEQMELTTDRIQAPVAWTTDVADRTISWLFSSLPASSTVTLLYRAQRHTPTATPTATNTDEVATPTATETPTSTPSPTATEGQTTSTPTATATQTATPTASSVAETPTASPTSTVTATPTATSAELKITKSGPAAVPVGANIVYTLTVTNPLTRSLTGLTIFDLVPVGSRVVNFGGGSTTMPPSQMIQWQVPLLNANSFVTRTFTIQLTMNTSQIRNELYFVDVIANGELVMRAVGEAPVVTTIEPPSSIDPSLLLGVATPPATNLSISNDGALVKWVYPGFSGQQLSNPVWNPLFQLYLPTIRGQ